MIHQYLIEQYRVESASSLKTHRMVTERADRGTQLGDTKKFWRKMAVRFLYRRVVYLSLVDLYTDHAKLRGIEIFSRVLCIERGASLWSAVTAGIPSRVVPRVLRQTSPQAKGSTLP